MIGPRYNVFPGPAVALDGPGARGSKLWCSNLAIDNAFYRVNGRIVGLIPNELGLTLLGFDFRAVSSKLSKNCYV